MRAGLQKDRRDSEEKRHVWNVCPARRMRFERLDRQRYENGGRGKPEIVK